GQVSRRRVRRGRRSGRAPFTSVRVESAYTAHAPVMPDVMAQPTDPVPLTPDALLAKGKKLKVLTEEEIDLVFADRDGTELLDFQNELAQAGVKVIPLDPGDLDAAAENWDESKLEE